MKRSKKWLLVLCMLLLLPLPCYLIWETSSFWQKYLKIKLPHLGSLNPIFAWYLIGISLIVFIILIVSLIVILFWPVQRNFNLIHKRDGQVKVTSKAINSYVMNSLADLPYLNNAKVSSKLTGRRIKIKIGGDLGPGENIAVLLDDYLEELKKNLKQLLGIEQKPKIKIKFINYHKGDKPEKRVQ
ncbi:hypothetical protein JF76_19030 [Lactobacillus kullabergensis]|uniref:Alkaline shock response membrane anchor protein AmaP n=1 Tax=Lactobacillus kullabergensis TaxID=1218493 RepID=A0A0F4L900_9LACO|nr:MULTISPECIES: alkaline shock response membrane anchor protein AmaP [Lactobacillus]KJY54046.1 hypothetical protein JF76_19030 [Lactobacillus kullabergensis]